MNNNQIADEIVRLKKERNAIILAHNYQLPEVQDIADFGGDSLELAIRANSATEKVIVFCGVHFMAETAAILNPEKKVLLPDLKSGCPMADMVDAEVVTSLKEKYPDAKFVVYVNSTAEVKALCDVCCTSANAHKIVERFNDDETIVFLPDQYLAAHVERLTGRALITYPGYCPTHILIKPEHIKDKRAEYPGAAVIVHPECLPQTCMEADEVLSTGGMCKFSKECAQFTIIVGTETGMLHRLKKENPQKIFIPANEKAVCPNMKRITLEKIAESLMTMKPVLKVPPRIAEKAKQAIIKMIDWS